MAAIVAPNLAVAAPAPDAPAATTPPVELKTSDDTFAHLKLPDDAKYYSELGQVFSTRPVLGPDGALNWFFSRQFASDDPRAIGLAIADPFVRPEVTTQNLPGTVALRGTGYTPWGYWPEAGAVTATSAVDVDGRTWLLDRVATPRPAHTELRGVLDGGSRPKSIRFPAKLTPYDAIPTDRGLRVIATQPGKRARDGQRAFITPPGSTKPVAVPKLDRGVIRAVARDNGGLLVVGKGSGSVPDSVVLVDRRGRTTGLADRRRPSAAATTGRAGAVRTPAGIVLDEASLERPGTSVVDKTAVVLRDARTGKVRLRRLLRDLEFEKAPACMSATQQYRAIALGAGPDGQAILTLSCGNTREHTVPTSYPPYSYTETATFEDQAVMVGLNDDLTVRWWRPAFEYLPMTPVRYGYQPYCANVYTDRDARLVALTCNGTAQAVKIPGARPAAGRLLRVKRAGKQEALARIQCRGPHGTVCSGRALLTANGQALGSAEYALPARPGGEAAELDRRISTTAPLPKRYTVRLLPRS